jgi:predicted XRE-type DNA-binding protein
MVKDTDYEVSSGNVFADLGVDAADEMLAKAKLATAILDVIRKRGLTQHQAAKLLNADRSYISKLKRGSELRRFTFDRLLTWLNKLDQDVLLTVKHKARNHNTARINVAI